MPHRHADLRLGGAKEEWLSEREIGPQMLAGEQGSNDSNYWQIEKPIPNINSQKICDSRKIWLDFGKCESSSSWEYLTHDHLLYTETQRVLRS